jgi:phosphoserine phosphatase RsbU/P
MSAAPELEVRPPGAPAFHVPLDPIPFRIGRNPDNHLVLRDNRASRSHAVIEAAEAGYRIVDAGSRSGVEVNGSKVESHLLAEGDLIRFCVEDSYELVFHATPSAASPTTGQQTGLKKLRSMLELARSLEGSLSLDHVLTSLVEAAIAVTNCERGFLLMREGEDLAVRIARDAHGRPLPATELDVPRHLLAMALRSRNDLLSMRLDPQAAGANSLDSSIQHLELRTILCVPLIKVRAGEMSETSVVGTIADSVGLLYLDSKTQQAELPAASRDLLQSLAIEASFVIENARLLEQERNKQKMEQELRIARTIQQDLLPDEKQLPSTGWLQAAGFSVSTRHVGGDYFDLIPCGEGRWEIVMADVSGKGLSAALLASVLQGSFIMATAEQLAPALVFERLNKFLLDRTEGVKYATIFLASVYRDGRMLWGNAAHCPPLLLRSSGEILELTATGQPVGMLEEAVYRQAETPLSPDDLLVLYTDGITEAHDSSGGMYGLERLVRVLRTCLPNTPAEIAHAVRNDLCAFAGDAAQHDDWTLFILRYSHD